jgi:hypothetical protein
MNQQLAAAYDKLLKDYSDLTNGVRMIRRAIDRACRAGALPAIERVGITPLEECEAIARVIYAVAARQKGQGSAIRLVWLKSDELSN